MRLSAEDFGKTYELGSTRSRPTVRGAGYALLAWLMGRTTGADLTVDGASVLPEPPFLY
jgi:maleylpyruvate isomerase